jgi:hypothetical protein
VLWARADPAVTQTIGKEQIVDKNKVRNNPRIVSGEKHELSSSILQLLATSRGLKG